MECRMSFVPKKGRKHVMLENSRISIQQGVAIHLCIAKNLKHADNSEQIKTHCFVRVSWLKMWMPCMTGDWKHAEPYIASVADSGLCHVGLPFYRKMNLAKTTNLELKKEVIMQN